MKWPESCVRYFRERVRVRTDSTYRRILGTYVANEVSHSLFYLPFLLKNGFLYELLKHLHPKVYFLFYFYCALTLAHLEIVVVQLFAFILLSADIGNIESHHINALSYNSFTCWFATSFICFLNKILVMSKFPRSELFTKECGL